MLFQYCKSTEEVQELFVVLFSFLQDSLSLNFKKNKQNEIFAHYCGFKSYNHLKAVLDGLPSEPQSIPSLPTIVLKAHLGGVTEGRIGAHLIEFLETELSCRGMSEDKRESLQGDFFMKCVGVRSKTLFHSQAISRTQRKSQIPEVFEINLQDLGKRKGLGKTIRTPNTHVVSSNTTVSFISERYEPTAIRSNHPKGMNICVQLSEFPVGLGYSGIHELVKPQINKSKTQLFVLPPSLMESFKAEVEKFLGESRATVFSPSDDFNGFPRGVVLVTERHFMKMDLSKIDLQDSVVSYTYYPHRLSVVSKTFSLIASNLRKFPSSLIYVDGLSSLITSDANKKSLHSMMTEKEKGQVTTFHPRVYGYTPEIISKWLEKVFSA